MRFGLVLLMLAFAEPAAAQSANACGLSGIGAISFDYDPLEPGDNVEPIPFQARCDSGVSVVLDAGQQGTFASRAMRSGAALLQYNVFVDSALSIVWGDGSGSTGLWTIPKNGRTTATLYVVVPAGQDVPIGQYSDQLTITVLP